MLRQIEWGVQNWPITKNGVLLVTTFFFRKFCFSLWTSYIELIWCYQPSKCPYSCFSKAVKFYFRVFFPCEYPYSRFDCGQNKECSRLCMYQKLIWMKEHIYSVKTRSQAGNIRVKFIMTTQNMASLGFIGPPKHFRFTPKFRSLLDTKAPGPLYFIW